MCPRVLVHMRTLLMSSFLFPPQSLACIALMVCEMGCKWSYNCYFLVYCFKNVFKTACSIFVKFSSIFFPKRFVKVQIVQPYSRTDTAIAMKNSCFILSEKSYFHMVFHLSIVIHTYPMRILTSLLVDEIFLPRYMNWSTNFRGLLFNEAIGPFW